jgi:hypothetical protein
LPAVTEAADDRDVVLEATDDQQGRCRGILEVDRRRIDRPDIEASLGCTACGAISDRSCEGSSATPDDQSVDVAGGRFVHDTIEVR